MAWPKVFCGPTAGEEIKLLAMPPFLKLKRCTFSLRSKPLRKLFDILQKRALTFPWKQFLLKLLLRSLFVDLGLDLELGLPKAPPLLSEVSAQTEDPLRPKRKPIDPLDYCLEGLAAITYSMMMGALFGEHTT